jgi:uncharacterized protein
MKDICEFDVLIIPGLGDAGRDHWQTFWANAFPHIRRVQQDDWQTPIFDDWAQRLSEQISRCSRPALLIAHSLGTSLVVRWAHSAATKTVAGAFLVAPTDRDRLNSSPARGFSPMLLRSLPFPSMVLASRNDEFVSFERAKEFAAAWGSNLVDLGSLGHINSAAKLGLWPQGLVWLGQFIASLPPKSPEK